MSEGKVLRVGDKVVGRMADDSWMEKHLNYEKHHLHRYGGWGLEKRHIKEMEEMGAKGLRLILDDGRVLEATMLALWTHYYIPPGIYEGQAVLSDRYWTDAAQARLL